MPTEESGDENEEFLQAFVSHEDALRSYARSLLPNWVVVDEVIQEASVVMWKKFDQLDSTDGFLPWAKVIVRFEALKAHPFFRGLEFVGDGQVTSLGGCG